MLGDGNVDLEEFVAFVKSWKRQGGKEPQRAGDLVYVSMRLAQLTKRAILGRGEINDMVWAHIEKHELQTGRGDGAWIEWDSVLERIFGSSRSEGDDHDGVDKKPPKKEKAKTDCTRANVIRSAAPCSCSSCCWSSSSCSAQWCRRTHAAALAANACTGSTRSIMV